MFANVSDVIYGNNDFDKNVWDSEVGFFEVNGILPIEKVYLVGHHML